jgi:uncharacterized protein YjaZ
MSVNLHILEASDRLTSHKDLIIETTEAVLQDIESQIHLPTVDVVFEDNPNHAIPNQATGGICPTAHLVRISINPEFEDIENVLAGEVRSSLAHELHHSARTAAVGYGSTFREVLISEGLAGHFDVEINGTDPKPWDIAVQGEELERMKQLAQKEFDNEDYNHYRWFFGVGDENIAHWTGYSLAFSLVGDYLKKNENTAAELVDVPAGEILIK